MDSNVADSMPELPAVETETYGPSWLEIEDAATIVSRGMSQLVLSYRSGRPRRANTHVNQNLVIDGANQTQHISSS